MTGDSWGHAIGLFERHYASWRIESTGSLYTARRKAGGRTKGPTLKAHSLDEMAALIDAAEESAS